MYTKHLHPVENINNNCFRCGHYSPTNIQFKISLMSVGPLQYINGYYTYLCKSLDLSNNPLYIQWQAMWLKMKWSDFFHDTMLYDTNLQ